MSVTICATCAVEHAEPLPEVCAICADERQYLPADGRQRWTTQDELAAAGSTVRFEQLEPDLIGLTVQPSVGIGQQAKLVRTPVGNLLWDPTGYLDDDVIARVRDLGGVAYVVPSHPHMFGVQVEWSRAFDAPVLVAEADREWVVREDAAIESWSGERELLPGVTVSQPGGHFPGSAVVHWAAGAEGRGVLLSGDTIFANPDRTTVSFMRSYPNRIPLSAAVVERIADHVLQRPFERLYNNFEGIVPADASAAVRRSADRHAAWVRGDFDHLT